MTLSLKMRALLFAIHLLGGKPLNQRPVAAARRVSDAQMPRSRVAARLASVSNRTIPGPDGEIPVRIYTPRGEGPFALLIFFHGGGFVVGSLDGCDSFCRTLCHTSGCLVISVGYRLAPEHKFPAATDDCLAATRWAVEHAVELHADPQRCVVAGDSAGGNLAAVTALRLREQGGPCLSGQLLIYPVTDYYLPPTPSYLTNGRGYWLTRELMIWFWDHYLNDAAEADHPFAAPLRASDLSRLPPALVITAEYDPLRDEGERYAQRLQQAGVPTRLSRYDGMIHGFLMLDGLFAESLRALDEMTAWLKQVTTLACVA